MKIDFLNSKNNEKTFQINSIFYHSSYSPEKEAQRFAENINAQNPSIIFLVEPGFNYTYKFLKEKFPQTKIAAIKLIKELPVQKWDYTFNFSSELQNDLIKTFSEDQLLSSIMINWPQAEKLFFEDVNTVWQAYKQAMIYAKTVLITREYFEKKWLINSVNFFIYSKKYLIPKTTQKPVIVAASGPSLKNAIPTLKKLRDNFVLVGLSSAITALLKNNLTPDFCMSCDGGFWAQRHLRLLNNKNIPLAISAESFLNKSLLSKLDIIPLDYKDGLSTELFSITNTNNLQARRNGTVSGTALELALNLTNNKVIMCGLDLASVSSFNHTQPNEIEVDNSIFDSRINPLETRITPQFYSSESLQIYRDWFCNFPDSNRVLRLIENPNNKKLGTIKDINSSELEEILKTQNKNSILNFTDFKKDFDFTKFKDYILKSIQTEKWQKQLFPISYIMDENQTEKNKENSLQKKINEITIKLKEILNDRKYI